MLIIPAIDLRGGKCVRLRQGRAGQGDREGGIFDGAAEHHVRDKDTGNIVCPVEILSFAAAAQVRSAHGLRLEVDDAPGAGQPVGHGGYRGGSPLASPVRQGEEVNRC